MWKYDCEDVRRAFRDKLAEGRFVADKTGCRTIEIIGASFLADEPAIFGTPNEDYIEREIEWYKSMSRNVKDMPGGAPTQWLKTGDKDGNVNSNYGWVVWSWENHHQFECVRKELSQNPDSRRAVMIYTRPTMWKDYNRNGMSDFMCTNVVQYFNRGGFLDIVVQMRSNDVVFGYKNDRAWQVYLQKEMAQKLGLELGDINWQVGSLHVYERHFHLVEEGAE